MEMSSRNGFIEERIYRYILDNSLRDLPVLEQLRRETAKMPMGGMQVSPDQGQFMGLMVKLTGARRIVEVGTFTGYSSLAMALALPEDGRIVACDVSEEYTQVARRYWKAAGVAHKIELRLGPGAQTLEKMLKAGEGGSYDLAFIDADKVSYDAYYEYCLKLLRQGGLIMIDNVLWGGRPANAEEKGEDTMAIRKLNAKIRADERVDQVLLSIGDGLTLARKR
jgi:predicted O-methyltransferase YrrM